MATALAPDPQAWEFARAIPAPITVHVYADCRAMLLDGTGRPRLVRRRCGRVVAYKHASAGHLLGKRPLRTSKFEDRAGHGVALVWLLAAANDLLLSIAELTVEIQTEALAP